MNDILGRAIAAMMAMSDSTIRTSMRVYPGRRGTGEQLARGTHPAPSFAMLLIGLTGNIAAGKTGVARHFAAWGATLIDADTLSRDAVAPGTPALAAIAERWGAGVLAPDGSLDRAALRAVVCSDPAERTALNAIVHPEVARRRDTAVAAAVSRRLATSGWTIALRAVRSAGSEQTTARSAARSSEPSGASTPAPHRSAMAASAGVPGATASRDSVSASMSVAPQAAKWRATAVLPAAMLPVSPMRSMANDGAGCVPRASCSPVPRRPGYTLIEVLMVLALMAIMAAMALPKISFMRYRQDANGRLVQRTLISAQHTSIKYNTNVLVVVDYAASRMRVVQDTNANGVADAAESWKSWALAEGARFAIPTTTVDGATAYYATGPGITTTAAGPTITFRPDGSASGDALVYVGLPNGNPEALRAIELAGSTGRPRLWRYLGGAWHRDSI